MLLTKRELFSRLVTPRCLAWGMSYRGLYEPHALHAVIPHLWVWRTGFTAGQKSHAHLVQQGRGAATAEKVSDPQNEELNKRCEAGISGLSDPNLLNFTEFERRKRPGCRECSEASCISLKLTFNSIADAQFASP